MKRFIASLLVTVALGGALVAITGIPSQATPPPVPGCQSRTSTQSSPGPWRYNYLEDWWQAGGYRVSSGCGRMVTVHSDGWRFDARQCGQAWIRRQSADGSTYIMAGTVKHVCGGQSVVLWSRAQINAVFWVETWPYATSDRRSDIWWAGTFTF